MNYFLHLKFGSPACAWESNCPAVLERDSKSGYGRGHFGCGRRVRAMLYFLHAKFGTPGLPHGMIAGTNRIAELFMTHGSTLCTVVRNIRQEDKRNRL
jgi:hypothetical protein